MLNLHLDELLKNCSEFRVKRMPVWLRRIGGLADWNEI